MNEQKVLMTDKESGESTEANSEEHSIWTRSDNSFKFNFVKEEGTCTVIQNHTASSPSHSTEHAPSKLTFTGQNSAFAFNFQISPEEDMDTTDISFSTSGNTKQCNEQGDPTLQKNSSANTSTSSKSKKKKKKTMKGKGESNIETKQSESTTESEKEELSAEEQLQRQLDWCIEQLEQGMRTHKATPKQKEEALQAIKTLRSSKAPLVKKRQVMRAMAGDYRKKMEDETSKQLKLVQNETAAAQVRVVTEFPKKSVFHRRAGFKEGNINSNNCDLAAEPDKNFVFTLSNDEFRFNFFN